MSATGRKGLDIMERLACRLHEVMERLDPTDDPSWDHMSELDREFYRQCAKAVVVELGEILECQELPITAEMLEAGVKVYRDWIENEEWDYRKFIARLYREMAQLAPKVAAA